ncbi:MAG: hypothetical protein NZ551_00420 [Microscillaceae bacterium]|nr:hypothetical protein [Microscillaceae bacterium]MDW8459653.1 hypothetical protein [Cytophagales bacterium]
MHCDPTASHYLKLLLDAIFCPKGGIFRNEIVWAYSGGGRPRNDFARKHDINSDILKAKRLSLMPTLLEFPII